ncbi:MAG: hypothetical protein IJO46_15250 [Thermoguttaceae bacterium]|nr:hypothetical protein [Thermoguttaceae bacterium]
MSYRPSARAALLSAATFATFATLAVSAVYASSPLAPPPGSTGSVATLESRRNEALPELRRTIKVYPAGAIYFGDALYVVDEEENRSKETMRVGLGFPIQVGSYSPWDGGSISSPEISGGYEFVPEDVCAMTIDYAWTGGDFLPGQKRVTSVRFFEFPPLEDWNAPFWKELREKLRDAPEGIPCKLSVDNAYKDRENRLQIETVDLEIVVKPRPNGETERLQRWRDTTPPKLFPIHRWGYKVPRADELKSSGASDIEIGGRAYDPWFFVRVGNRKPSDPNNPTTLDGWRALEAEFAPSTLRDEITLTRLQIEYYDAPDAEASDAALQALTDWLRERPEPQRVALTYSLYFSFGAFRNFQKTPLEEKRRNLLQAISLESER